MPLAIVYSRAAIGMQAPLVTVETHLSNGLPKLSIVGLPEAAVKESKDRVRSAIINANFDFPMQRITINLAPADLPKDGGRYDLPIALGILAASGQIPVEALEKYEFAGELALSGDCRPVKGILPMAIQTAKANKTLVTALDNAKQAALCENLQVLSADNLLAVCAHLKAEAPLPAFTNEMNDQQEVYAEDFDDVKGQFSAKQALEIAAAGAHNVLMIGPPGTGKTMLASRLPTILPPLSQSEAIEITAVHSLSKGDQQSLHLKRPFRHPHHTASAVALVGGGSNPKPGEISLAHKGVLFLDELPEFSRHVLEVLREPMESGTISISRATQQVEFPARFQLIAAMNPCPCGYYGDNQKSCRCTPEQIQRYQAKISGPFLDRFDITIEVTRIPTMQLHSSCEQAESSETIRERVVQARAHQIKRQHHCNAELSAKDLQQYCELNATDHQFIVKTIEKLGASPRVFHRLLKVARTIADLAGEEKITRTHLMRAIQLRRVDKYFAFAA